MFTSRFVRMHLQRCAIRTEPGEDETTFPVAAVSLAIEPLTWALAKELGPSIANHFFTNKGELRTEVANMVVKLRQIRQSITVHMAEDVAPHVVLRQVRIPRLSVILRGEHKQKADRQGKKIAPQAPVLRASLGLLVDPAERSARDFLCAHIGATLFFTFDDEEKSLPFERGGDAEEGGAGDGLPLAPAIDPAAGEPENPAPRPRLAKSETKH